MAVLTNTMMQGTAAIDDGDYKIENSVRFKSADSTMIRSEKIFRNGNTQIWTWSGWVKRNTLGTAQSIFSCGEGGDGHDRDGILFMADDTLTAYWRTGGSTVEEINTKRVFRDPSAWYHIVWAFNRRLPGTMSHRRSKIYINGTPIFPDEWNQQIDSSPNTEKMNTYPNYFHYGQTPAGDKSDMQLADVQFHDGLYLPAHAFGERDATGVWNPKAGPTFSTPNTDAGSPNWVDDTTITISDGPYSGYPTSNIFDDSVQEPLLSNSVQDSWAKVVFDNPVTVNHELAIDNMLAQNPGESPLYQKVWYSINDGPEILWTYGSGGYTGTLNHHPAECLDSENGHLWTGELTSIKIRQTTTNGSNCQLHWFGIFVDGVALTNNTVDPTYDKWLAGNTPGRIWSHSSNGAGTFYSGLELAQAFKGFIGWDWGYTWMSHDDSWSWWRPVGGITASSSIRVYARRGGDLSGITTWVKLNDVDITGTFTTALDASGKKGWVTLPTTGGAHTVNDTHGLGIYRRGSDGHCIRIYAIEVDGAILTDGNINSHHLKFDDLTSSTSLGKNSLNRLLPVSESEGGLPFYNTSGSAGGTKISGYRADSSAGTTDGTGLVFAMPGDVLTDEHDEVNTGSSAQTITNTGTVTNATTQSKYYGTAIKFAGKNSGQRLVIDGGTDFVFGTGDFTIECWAWIDSDSSNSADGGKDVGIMQLSSNANGYVGSNSNTLTMIDTDGSTKMYAANGSQSGFWKHRAEWHHWAIVRKASTTTLYIDGAVSKAVSDSTDYTGQYLAIGTYYTDSRTMDGYINDFRIYKGVAKYTQPFQVNRPNSNDFRTVNNLQPDDGTAASVAITDATGGLPIYNTSGTYGATKESGYRTDSSAGTTNDTGLVLAIPGDSVGASTCDVHQAINTGSSNKAIVTNNGSVAVVTNKSKHYGSSLYFDDNTQYITFADDGDWDIGTGDYTIECWVYFETIANDETILGVYQGNQAWQFFIGGGAQKPGFQIRQTDNNWKDVYADNIYAGTWHHLAATVEGTNLKIWVDGVLGGTTAFDGTVTSCNSVLQIGSRAGGTSNKFNGWISDIRIYKGVAKYTSNFTVSKDERNVFGQDATPDTPTIYGDDTGGGTIRGNYCTLNPLDTADNSGSQTFKQGNLYHESTSSAGAWHKFRGTMAIPKGSTDKFYYEVEWVQDSGDTDFQVGWVDPTFRNTNAGGFGDFENEYCFRGDNGKKFHNNSQTTYGSAPSEGDIVGVGYDNGSIRFWVNGTEQDSGTAAWTGIEKPLMPGFATYTQSNATFKANFNFGQRAFKHPQSGYKSICSANLEDTFSGDELNNPSKYFDAKAYEGSGASRDFKYNFGPELIWAQQRSGTGSNRLYNILTGTGKHFYTDTDAAEVTEIQNITAFNADGYTMGTNGDINSTGHTFVNWAWDAGTTASGANDAGGIDVSAGNQWVNATAGFSITKYTGTGSATTVGHGLNAKPDFIIIRRVPASDPWQVGHSALATTEYLKLEDGAAATADSNRWPNTAHTNTLVQLGNDGMCNGNAHDYIMLCWTAIEGYSAFGKYTGNGSDTGPFVYTGFRPKFLMLKRSSGGTSAWTILDSVRENFSGNPTGDATFADGNWAEIADRNCDFLSNGFKVRDGDGGTNPNGDTAIYMAFAEHPFKTARAK